jgi:hypothetical protein
MHAHGNCLLRGIIFAVGNNEEMHLSPTKKHGIHRVISGDYFRQLSMLVSFPKILQYNKDYMSKTGYLLQRCNMMDGLFNHSETLRFQFQPVPRVEGF